MTVGLCPLLLLFMLILFETYNNKIKVNFDKKKPVWPNTKLYDSVVKRGTEGIKVNL